jgi:hypothetical protein
MGLTYNADAYGRTWHNLNLNSDMDPNSTLSETEQLGKLLVKGKGTGWSLLFGRNPHPVAHAVFSDWNSSLLRWASLGGNGARRTIGDCQPARGHDSQELVMEGWCWWY